MGKKTKMKKEKKRKRKQPKKEWKKTWVKKKKKRKKRKQPKKEWKKTKMKKEKGTTTVPAIVVAARDVVLVVAMAIALERRLAARRRFVIRILAFTLFAVTFHHPGTTTVPAIVVAACDVVLVVAMAISLERRLAARRRFVARILALTLRAVGRFHPGTTAVPAIVVAACDVV